MHIVFLFSFVMADLPNLSQKHIMQVSYMQLCLLDHFVLNIVSV